MHPAVGYSSLAHRCRRPFPSSEGSRRGRMTQLRRTRALSRSLILGLALGTLIGLPSTGAAAASASGYHFVGHPVVVFWPAGGTYFYSVIFRLSHAIPERNHHPLGRASIDGAGGSSGLSHVAERSRRNPRAHCYQQVVSNDFSYPRALRQPRSGAHVKVLIAVARGSRSQRHFFFSLRVPLQRSGNGGSSAGYARGLGCLSR